MKKLIFLLTLMVLTLASASAFADDLPVWDVKNIATEEFARAFPKSVTDLSVLCAKDFSSGVLGEATTYDNETVRIDTGRTLYAEALLRTEPVMKGYGARGAAAGGVCPEGPAVSKSEHDRIWEGLPIFHGGGDMLPPTM